MERIQAGLDKYGGQYLVLDTAFCHANNMRTRPATDPLMTQTTRQTMGFASPPFLTSVNYFDERDRRVDEPLPTQTTANKTGVTIPPSAILAMRKDYKFNSPAGVLPTLVATGSVNGLLQLPPSSVIVLRQHTEAKSPTDPLTTITAGGFNHGLLTMPFLVLNYTPGVNKPVTDSMGTITATDHHALVQPEPFIMSYYGAGGDHPVTDAMMTVTSIDKHALVQGKTTKVEDCFFRMLQPGEIGAGMAFGRDYVVLGNKREQVRQYGNAVTPPVAEWLFKRCTAILD